MLRLLSKAATRHGRLSFQTLPQLVTSYRLIHYEITRSIKPPPATSHEPSTCLQSGKTASVDDVLDDGYSEAVHNLKLIGVGPILDSALEQWSKLESHGKPYIRPDVRDKWRKNVILEFVNRLCDPNFVEKTKSSKSLSREIDKVLVTSALELAESEDECVTILCPGAPHLGVEHENEGIKYVLKERAFCKDSTGKPCLKFIWESADTKKTLYESNNELDTKNMMWSGTLDELFDRADTEEFKPNCNSLP